MKKNRNFALKTWLVRGFGGMGLIALGLVAATAARQHRKFEAPYPALHASRDPAVIERGRYLAFGAAHCSACHGASDGGAPKATAVLSGGQEFRLPVGVFRAPNITPDRDTGIGRYSDEELARMLRFGVRPNGETVLPFMPFQNLSDEDLTALISYLRSQSPVRHEVAPHTINPLGRLVNAFVLTPRGPTAPPLASVPREVTPAYGRYLAHSVANCVGCHTRMDLRTGELVGPTLAGGAEHPSTSEPGKHFVAPNLTPDERWGWLEGWSEDAFVARLRAGRSREGSPMPWEALSQMGEDDMRALYRYLRTLPASPGGPDPKDRDSVAQPVAAR